MEKETVREDQGYQNTNPPKSLCSLLPKGSGGGAHLQPSKSDLRRVMLKMDGQIYAIREEVAADLVRRRKAEYV